MDFYPPRRCAVGAAVGGKKAIGDADGSRADEDEAIAQDIVRNFPREDLG